MDYRIAPSPDRRYIVIEVDSDFTAAEMMTCIVESHTLGRGMDIHAYLVDVTRARNIDSVMGNYQFAYSDMQMVDEVDPLARVAALVSPGDHSHDFVETVSENAGMTLKLFTDRDQALAFLLKEAPSTGP